MAGWETSMGGAEEHFPTTHWTQLLRLRNPHDPQYQHHLNRLLHDYWKPCYYYIRRCWHMSVEDAKDLTQEFFSKLLEKEYLQEMSPEKGSFRGYIRTALFHFMSKAKRHERVRRPRDGAQLIHFQADDDLSRADPPAGDASPDETFERAWVEQVLRQSMEELRSMLEAMGKTAYLQVFDKYYGIRPSDAPPAPPGPRPTYGQVAADLNLKETDVRNYLTFTRNLLRKLIVGRVRQYVSTEEELQSEVAHILGES